MAELKASLLPSAYRLAKEENAALRARVRDLEEAQGELLDWIAAMYGILDRAAEDS